MEREEVPLLPNLDLVLSETKAALVLASLLSATWGYRIRKYKAPPSPSALREFYLMEEPQKAKLAVVDYLCSAYDWNQELLEGKVKYTHGSFIFVLLGAVIIGVTILINLL